MTKLKNIRNFSIVAHIDHGKSTLSDRIIQACQGLSDREMKAQVLDSMELEREKGITIKAQTVRLKYEYQGEEYIFNLMDTPGHVDFTYEVSRSLAACEGALLVVDATQGVEAQTLANTYLALENNLEILPVLNKVDLPSAEPHKIKAQIEEVIGLPADEATLVSAKTGLGIDDLLKEIVEKLPCPQGDLNAPLKALLVDSWYDTYLGVVILVRIYDGELTKGQKIKMMSNGSEYFVEALGYFTPKTVKSDRLGAGEMGYLVANIKSLAETKVGDTITLAKGGVNEPLAGFNPSTPVVFAGIYPIENNDFNHLKEALEKLNINDSSFSFEATKSTALGFGFRCGFLGLLHLEIIQERLSREFNLDLITTAPSVIYKVTLTNGEVKSIYSPAEMPEPVRIKTIEEPWVKGTILVPEAYLGDILTLCAKKRGQQVSMNWVNNRAMLVYNLPLAEIVFNFYDILKSVSKGYASFNYEIADYQVTEAVKVNILINHEVVDALSFMAHKSAAEHRGRVICEKLKDLIPRQMFQIPIQAAIGGKIIARETISAFRKDVTAKCYGGDITRKRKLLEKQKEGKKKMRTFGRVEIPQSVFINVLKVED